jgi:hypothetical protein
LIVGVDRGDAVGAGLPLAGDYIGAKVVLLLINKDRLQFGIIEIKDYDLAALAIERCVAVVA